MRFSSETINPVYLSTIAKSKLLRGQIGQKFITTAGQKAVNQRYVSSLLLRLPPLAEQVRIVAKVESLLGLCDALESRLRAAHPGKSSRGR
jgi:type I restriction enzyme S subunit